jgi:hypothetical protein
MRLALSGVASTYIDFFFSGQSSLLLESEPERKNLYIYILFYLYKRCVRLFLLIYDCMLHMVSAIKMRIAKCHHSVVVKSFLTLFRCRSEGYSFCKTEYTV